PLQALAGQVDPARLAAAARQAVTDRRAALAAGASPDLTADALATDAARALANADKPRLCRVLNATGVVVHTNLGRAPLAASAIARVVATAAGYSNLEYDLESGTRGAR